MPPGPPLPRTLQTVLFLTRPHSFVRRCQDHYGDIFTLRLGLPGGLIPGPVVYLTEPAAIQELFRLDGREGHAGKANVLLEPLTGPHSLLLLDGDEHLRERRLISPAFHGDALRRLEGAIRAAAEREVGGWKPDEVLSMRPAMQRVTFEVIMRAVLGVEDRALQARLLEAFEPVFNLSPRQLMGLVPMLRVDLGSLSPWGRLRRNIDRLDDVLLDVISQRRCEGDRDDILGLLLEATDESGERLGNRHVRDELVTLLLAGHETTATALAWAFERLAHNGEVVAWARRGIAAGEAARLEAVVAETLRVRPIVMDVARRLTAEIEVGGYELGPETTVMAGIHLVQLDPARHREPDAFRPQRFEGRAPSAETWLPFGGGRRRCIGAGLAQMEMRIVLETVLRDHVPEAVSEQEERPRLRGITWAPEHDGQVRMRRAPLPARAVAAAPPGVTA